MNNNLLKAKGALNSEYTSNIHRRLQNEQKTQALPPKTHKPKTRQTLKPKPHEIAKLQINPQVLNAKQLEICLSPAYWMRPLYHSLWRLQVLNLRFTLYLSRGTQPPLALCSQLQMEAVSTDLPGSVPSGTNLETFEWIEGEEAIPGALPKTIGFQEL